MNGIQNYGTVNQSLNFKAGRTKLWDEAVLDVVIANFNKKVETTLQCQNRPLPIALMNYQNEYTKLGDLKLKILNRIVDCLKNSKISADGAIRQIDALNSKLKS